MQSSVDHVAAVAEAVALQGFSFGLKDLVRKVVAPLSHQPKDWKLDLQVHSQLDRGSKEGRGGSGKGPWSVSWPVVRLDGRPSRLHSGQ